MPKLRSSSVSSRLDRWKKPAYLGPFYSYAEGKANEDDDKVVVFLSGARRRYFDERRLTPPQETSSTWINRCKELIFDIEEGAPVFHAIAYSFNVGRGELELGHMFDICASGETEEETSQNVRSTMADALVGDVPVTFNTESLAQEFARYHRDLMVDGFTAPDEKGKPVRLKLVQSPGPEIETLEYFLKVSLTGTRPPAELVLARNVIKQKLEQLTAADLVLSALSIAIQRLTSALTTTCRNESDLQACLTENPILFGLEYQRFIAKHRLGAEYEMDYALVRISGLVDLVEIEASTHNLFTKGGNPTKELVHAEQQILDWQDWLERHHDYASASLPGVVRPRGYIVIGSSSRMTQKQRDKLNRRNTIFQNAFKILTYDDLLKRATNMKNMLLGLRTSPD